MDRPAAKLGIGPGLTLADARARVPALAAGAFDPEADARLLQELALFCGRYTPMAAAEGRDGLILDITGCDHLFGGEAALRTRAIAGLARLGVEARGAVADGPDAARALAATFERRKTVLPAELPDALASAFAQDPTKRQQWNALLRDLAGQAPSLEEVVGDLARFLMPHVARARGQ